MCKLLISIIVFTIIFSVAVVIYCIYNNQVKQDMQENWEAYKQTPLNYIYSGSSPLVFYRRDRYRKPFRYPIKHYDSSPFPNMSYWP